MALAKPLVEAAATAQAMKAQFEQVFGDLQKNAQDTIDKLGKDFGMLPNRIKPTFTSITSMFKGFGMSTEESMNAASKAVTLAADAAAFYDTSMDNASGAITSFLKGNTNAAESIGIFATAAGMATFASDELGLSWNALDEGGKQLVRLKYVEKMQEAAGATGQAARESMGLENVLGNLKQSWEDIKAKFGEPILEPVVAGLAFLASAIASLDVESITVKFESAIAIVKDIVSGFVIFWQEHKDKIMAVMQSISDGIDKIIIFITEIIKSSLNFIKQLWEEHGQEITTIISEFFEAVSEFIEFALGKIQDFWEEHGENITAVVKTVWDVIYTFISYILEQIKTVIQVVTAIIKGDWQTAWDGVKQIFVNAWETMTALLPLLLDSLYNVLRASFSIFLDLGEGMFNMVWEGMKNIWNSLSTWVSEKVAWLIDKLAFWRNTQSAMSGGGGEGVNGSHAGGLAYVPFDGYKSELHKGERVLTAEENKQFNQPNQQKSGDTFIFNSPKAIDEKEAARLQRRARREMAFNMT